MDLIGWFSVFVSSAHGLCKQSQRSCRGIHTPFNQQSGQFQGQHIQFCNQVNNLLSAALAVLFFSLQLCLSGDSIIGIFDFQYFCVMNCFLRFICVQLDLPQEIPFKESLLLVLQNFQLLFQSEEDCSFQTSICTDITATVVHIGRKMTAHIKRSL